MPRVVVKWVWECVIRCVSDSEKNLICCWHECHKMEMGIYISSPSSHIFWNIVIWSSAAFLIFRIRYLKIVTRRKRKKLCAKYESLENIIIQRGKKNPVNITIVHGNIWMKWNPHRLSCIFVYVFFPLQSMETFL